VSAGDDLEGLLQFFYQCPVGLLEITDGGAVEKINPAAARMLASALAGDDLQELFPLLDRLAPRMVAAIQSDPWRLGPLGDGQRLLVPSGFRGDDCLELLAVRVRSDRVMVVLVDVSVERRLAQREHEIVVELQRSMLGRVDPIPGLPVDVTYRTADLGLQVGGDWYDVVGLPDERGGQLVGDVVGHNLQATATMGQLRSAVRAVAPPASTPRGSLTRPTDLPTTSRARATPRWPTSCSIRGRASWRTRVPDTLRPWWCATTEPRPTSLVDAVLR
jgi:Stage II sporulation protein E (SpoIIE)